MELYSQVGALTVFVLFLGLSSLFVSKLKNVNWKLFFRVEFLLSIKICLMPVLLGLAELFSESVNQLGPYGWIVLLVILLVPFAFLTGLELPLLITLLPERENILLFLNYFGSLFASIIAVEIFYSSEKILFLCAIISTLNFIVYFIFSKSILKVTLLNLLVKSLVFGCALVILAFYSSNLGLVKKINYLGYDIVTIQNLGKLFDSLPSNDKIISIESRYQEIDIVPASMYQFNPKDSRWGLYLNRKVQFFSDTEIIYHQTISFFPLIYTGIKPKKVLILGGGDLGVARELSRLPELKVLKVVELDEAIINLAKNGPLVNQMNNYNQIKDFVEIVHQDALSYLRNTNERYDFIVADFPFPSSFELGNLYSKEFYQLVISRLSNKGVFTFDFPFHISDNDQEKEVQAILLNTLQASGFKQIKIYGRFETFVMATKRELDLKVDISSYQKYLSNKVLINFVERTTHYAELYKRSSKIHSLFKPQMEFRIE